MNNNKDECKMCSSKINRGLICKTCYTELDSLRKNEIKDLVYEQILNRIKK